MHVWQSQDAKAHFSEFVRASTKEGPQMVSVRSKIEAVLISIEEYELLIGKKPSFLDFINQSPLKGLDLDIERDQSLGRDIDL